MGPATIVVPSLPACHPLIWPHSGLMLVAANSGNGGDLDMPPDERLSHWLHGLLGLRPFAATTALSPQPPRVAAVKTSLCYGACLLHADLAATMVEERLD